MDNNTLFFLWFVLLIYNISTFIILRLGLSQLHFSSILVEKLAINQPDQSKPTSASRVIAFIGSIVLATFLWALGNVVLFKAVQATDGGSDIGSLLSEIGNFFLAGSALFAPYAFNQLSRVFGIGGGAVNTNGRAIANTGQQGGDSTGQSSGQ